MPTDLLAPFDLLVDLFMEQRAKQGITPKPTLAELRVFILNFEMELQKELSATGVSTLSELVAKGLNQ